MLGKVQTIITLNEVNKLEKSHTMMLLLPISDSNISFKDYSLINFNYLVLFPSINSFR